MRVGTPTKYGPRDYADVPVSFVAHARSVLGTPPGDWCVRKTVSKNISGESFPSICIRNKNGDGEYKAVYFHGRWVWLGDEVGLATLSQIFQFEIHELSASVNSARLNDVCNKITWIFRCHGRAVLSEEFKRIELTPMGLPSWLGARNKNPADLVKYAGDPIFRPSPTGYTITYYVITPQGAIERWKIQCKSARETLIQKIEVHIEQSAGAFSYPLVG